MVEHSENRNHGIRYGPGTHDLPETGAVPFLQQGKGGAKALESAPGGCRLQPVYGGILPDWLGLSCNHAESVVSENIRKSGQLEPRNGFVFGPS